MKPENHLEAFRSHTAAPPTGARERVWRQLEAPAQPQRRSAFVPVFALAASMLVGVGVVKLVQSRNAVSSERWNDERSAIAWDGAKAKLDKQTHAVTLEDGAVAVSSWGAPVNVNARGHQVRIESGLALIQVAGDEVSAEAIEGALLFDGQLHTARTKSESASDTVKAVLAIETESLRARRLVKRAEQSVSEQRFEDAVRDLETVASSGTLDAEVANFKQAELELRKLNRPESALKTLGNGDAKFPRGALSQERQLSEIESLVKLERWSEVELNTSTFLTRFADSERADEVRRLHDEAARRLGKSP